MTEAATKLSAEQITAILDNHIGSLERYRHYTRRFIYTPGVRDLAELAGAYWLLDLIAAHCRRPHLAVEPFQLWTLTVAADRGATVTVTDGDTTELLRETVPWTDFPLPEISLYLIEGTLLLPREY